MGGDGPALSYAVGAAVASRTVNSIRPTFRASPVRSSSFVTRSPFTNVPFVLSRSSTSRPSA
jgi:hypothetical protein